MKTIINPKYNGYSDIIMAIPINFNRNDFGDIIRLRRNHIKKLDNKFVIKKYVKMTFANRLIYSFIRKTKARRAYEYTNKLRLLGVNTPDEVAYIEIKKWGILIDSYFISIFNNTKSMEDIFECGASNNTINIVKSYVKFLVNIHKKGIVHNDLVSSNILVNLDENSGTACFNLIDYNNMSFKNKPLSLIEIANNLKKVSYNKKWYYFLLREYEKVIGCERLNLMEKCCRIKKIRERRVKIRKFIKKYIKI